MNVLLLIDIQNDFLPGGSLAVPDGDSVVNVANDLIESFAHVVATQDWHPADHGSFASQHDDVAVGDVFQLAGLPQVAWPDHCVEDTAGAQFAESLRTEKIDCVFHKGTERMIDSYSGFFDNDHRQSTGLHDYLQSIGASKLTVAGLATDYCVKFTVLDALELGYGVKIVLDGCRGVDLAAGDVQAAIESMRAAGAELS